MRYGFVIDHRKCIGCHACTVACKEENRVPLGAFRTWVKYVEKGTFPNTRRYFSVLRCNHCDDAPCVAICPTVALYRRPDGIVDFDSARCIGCKSCMQACPYDALYIDPDTRTAAKCHYCAHRVEVGLEPACVIVCPEQAIIAGDLDDPTSLIARLVAREQVDVRKPEQGTRPKVFYVGAESSALTPQQQQPVDRYLWSQRPAEELDLVRLVAAQAGGDGGGALGRPVYDVPHLVRPWGWKVAGYLWTKSVAAGALLIAALASVVGVDAEQPLFATAAPVLALVFLAITTALLVFDLKRPDRFHYLLLRPNRRSWLVWGAYILIGYGIAAALWLAAGVLGPPGWLRALAAPTLLLAGAAAGYSAFLFGQAEGRDFWQSPLLLPQLLIGAALAGAAALLPLGIALGAEPATIRALMLMLAASLAAHGLVVFAELAVSHASVDVVRAARLITRGRWRWRFWAGVAAAGIAVPLGCLAFGACAAVAGALLALIGLLIYEDLWVKAGQSVPLS